MKIIQRILRYFRKRKAESSPLVIIKKGADEGNIKEYNSIEEAIRDLENDPNISREKINKLKESLKNLKNKSLIKIRDGELLK